MNVYKDIIVGLGLCLLLCSCRAQEPAAPTEAQVEAPVAASASTQGQPEDAPAAGVAREQDANPAVARLLREIQNKQKCNRVMGCEPWLALLQLGKPVAPATLDTLQQMPLVGHYWQLRLIALLGQLQAVEALDLLHDALEQPRWEMRTRSAMAVADIGDPRSLGPLEALLARHHDVVSDAAALHALDALGARVEGRPAREVLIERLPTGQAELGELNPGYFTFLAELVGAASLREALQLTRWGAIHRDRFTRMASLQTLAQLKDTEGVPYAITRLDDESPGIRRQALRTLRLITGRQAFTEAGHWKDWCQQRRCLEPLRKLSPPSVPSP